MADPLFKWFPRGEGGAVTYTLSEVAGLQVFRGETRTDRQSQFSKAGLHVSVAHDAWSEHEIRIEGVSRVNDPIDWHALAGLVAHVQGGGEFEFARDSALVADVVTTTPITRGDTVIGSIDTSDMTAGETLLVEDSEDFVKRDFWRIATVDSGSQITLSYGSRFGFAAGAVVRSVDYFPDCAGVSRGAVRWNERDAGRGAGLWDLRLRFRTTRLTP